MVDIYQISYRELRFLFLCVIFIYFKWPKSLAILILPHILLEWKSTFINWITQCWRVSFWSFYFGEKQHTNKMWCHIVRILLLTFVCKNTQINTNCYMSWLEFMCMQRQRMWIPTFTHCQLNALLITQRCQVGKIVSRQISPLHKL